MTLTVDQLREHVTSELSDEALQRLLDAAYGAIATRIGPAGDRVEQFYGGFRTIGLGRPTDSVSSVSETIGTTTTTLNANDYRLRPDGYTLERLATGTNPRWYWFGTIMVTSTPVGDDATRDEVAIDLCRLALNYNPGLTMEQVGSWTTQFVSSSIWNNAEEREAILGRLAPSLGVVVVGGSPWSAW